MSRRDALPGDVARTRTARAIALSCVAFVAFMLALSFAAVPLYRIFCQVTGFGGTTQRADRAADEMTARTVTVRFDGNVARGMAWEFRPLQTEVTARLGETKLAYFGAHNLGGESITGIASFNVVPEKAAVYFKKIECFCFSEQTLAANERVEMPVSFYVDPALASDPAARDVDTITLSYTFFKTAGSRARVAAITPAGRNFAPPPRPAATGN